MTKQIKASEIQPGMIVRIYGGTEQLPVTKATADKYGAVIVTDSIRTRGLSQNETVEFVGYFNP